MTVDSKKVVFGEAETFTGEVVRVQSKSRRFARDKLGRVRSKNNARTNDAEPHGAGVGYSTFIRCSFWTACPAGRGFFQGLPAALLLAAAKSV
jgi:hypothetical protein